jgi:hypothetical protein
VATVKKINIVCPVCHQSSDINLPDKIIDKFDESGIVTVSFKTECGHLCHAFIDKSFKLRGEACADLSLEELAIGKETPEMIQASDLVMKMASEIIRTNVQYSSLINQIGLLSLINDIEKALIRCQITSAKDHLDLLHAQAFKAGEVNLALQFGNEITWINKLLNSRNGFDWSSIEMHSLSSMDVYEYAHMKGVQYNRLRQIFATLEFEAIEHELPRDAVDKTKSRLMDLLEDAD